MLLRAPTSMPGFGVLLGCANTGPVTAAHEHCEPLSKGPWLQQSPGGTPEVVADVLDSHRCDFIEGAEHIPQREIVGDATTWDPTTTPWQRWSTPSPPTTPLSPSSGRPIPRSARTSSRISPSPTS